MDYNETIAYIHNTPKFARELGNALLKKLLDKLGNPQKKLKFIHIAGTNGKGSTAAMLAEILQRAGYKVGLFTSPFIEVFNERIKLNGECIPNDDLARIVTEIRTVIETNNTPVSEFALDTAAAFCYFEEEKCDIVVLETGMGGRLDATNVIEESIVTVLTSIGLDHTQYLGETIGKITKEKCGILRKGCPVICYPKLPVSAVNVIMDFADKMSINPYFAEEPKLINDGMIYKNKRYTLGLKGDFQIFNAAVVLETINVLKSIGFKISDTAIEEGLKKTKHSARFELFGDSVILDGGHNQDAMKELVKSLENLHKPVYLCIAMMEDKDYVKCVDIISDIAKLAVVTEIDMPRCCPAEKLAAAFKKNSIPTEVIPDAEKALKRVFDLAANDEMVCICGSLYLAGKIRPILNKSANLFT